MSEIPPIQGSGSSVGSVGAIRNRGIVRSQAPTEQRGMDDVQISQIGRLLSELEMPTLTRADRLDFIKQEIQAGTYLNPTKVSITAQLLLEDMQAGNADT